MTNSVYKERCSVILNTPEKKKLHNQLMAIFGDDYIYVFGDENRCKFVMTHPSHDNNIMPVHVHFMWKEHKEGKVINFNNPDKLIEYLKTERENPKYFEED